MMFVSKEIVDAIQFLGTDNLRDVVQWIGPMNASDLTYRPVKGQYFVHVAGLDVELEKGDWIVRSHGRLSRFKDGQFQREFSRTASEPNWDAVAQSAWHLGAMNCGQDLAYVRAVLKAAADSKDTKTFVGDLLANYVREGDCYGRTPPDQRS